MHRLRVQALIALILVASLSLGMAAAPAVGIVTAWGSFSIDASSISGNATLFEGNQIETGKVSSRLQLNAGAKVQLAAESRGIVYRDRLVLERGSSRFEKAGNYQVEALSLRIRPDGDDTAVRVSLRNPGVVQVAALTGPVRVTAANGVLLANLAAGRTADFTPDGDTGPAAPTKVTGCLESSSGKFLLTDEVSMVRFEVMGAGVAKEVGHRVQIAGTVTPVPESMSQVHSTSVKQLSKKCSKGGKGAAAAGVGAAGAGAAGAGGAAGGAAAGGIGAAIASHAVIAGVIVAGAATAATVAVVKTQGDSTPISPSGR